MRRCLHCKEDMYDSFYGKKPTNLACNNCGTYQPYRLIDTIIWILKGKPTIKDHGDKGVQKYKYTKQRLLK